MNQLDIFKQSVYAYHTARVRPGAFLLCVLKNDLQGAISHASKESLALLPELLAWLDDYLDLRCWGDAARVDRWLAKGGNNDG